MLCVGKNLTPPIYRIGENSEPFRVPIFRPANPLILFQEKTGRVEYEGE
jgi:hypothetical protein